MSNVFYKVFYSGPLSIAYFDPWYIPKLSIFRNQDIKNWESLKYSLHRTMLNLGIFTTLYYLSPTILRAQGKLRNLSNMYDVLFSTEPCVTLVYSELETYSEPWWKILFSTLCNLVYLEPWHIQNLKHIQNTSKHLSGNTLFKILCNLDTFRTLSIFRTLVLSEIKAFRIQNLAEYLRWSILL